MRGIAACLAAAALMAIAVPARLEGQGRATARCEACREAAATYNRLLDQYDEAVRRYRETKQAMDDLWEQKWSDEDELRRKRATATNRGRREHLKMLEDRIAAAPPAIDKASTEYAEAYAQMQEVLRQIGEAWVTLVRCNERCAVAGASTPAPMSVTPETAPATPSNAPAPTPVCDECAGLLEELEKLEKQRQETNATVGESNRRTNELRREMGELYDQTELLNTMRQNGDPSVKLSDEEYKARLEQVQARIRQIQDVELAGELETRLRLWAELDAIEKSIREWWVNWRRCNERCGGLPKKTSWFSRPLFWAPIGGAIGGMAVAGGGNSTSGPPGVAAQPSPQVSTTNSSPPPSPEPSRRPAAAYTVNGCLCVDNSAALDALLQLCQRLRQIRTTGSGNAITLTGDAPLPAFQGTFNEITGEFELTTTTTIGSTTSTVVMAGRVEMNGNIQDARVNFGGANGRRTLYTLTLTPVP